MNDRSGEVTSYTESGNGGDSSLYKTKSEIDKQSGAHFIVKMQPQILDPFAAPGSKKARQINMKDPWMIYNADRSLHTFAQPGNGPKALWGMVC